MNGCAEQHKQLKTRSWLSLALVATTSMLFYVNDANAQRLDVSAVRQQSDESTLVLSGLPTLAEISSTKINEQVKQIVAQLDSYSFAKRELAVQLLVTKNIDRRQICKVLSGNDLSSEQRHRLVDWLRHDLLTTPHAAIGISIGLRRINGAIVVGALIEDLPAIEVLMPGDQIIGLDGLLINERDAFLQSIGSRKPGDKVTITVKRSIELVDKNDASKIELRELNYEIILGSDELLFNVDGIRTGNALVQRALNRDLAIIVDRYGPKVLRIEGGETPKPDLDTTADK